LVITRDDDPSDKIELIKQIADCVKLEEQLNPPFKVKSGKTYTITLYAKGFNPGEVVEGKAAVNYSLFLDAKKTRASASFGTVLDNTIGLAGIIQSVSDDKMTIVLEAVSSDGVHVKATLEEGLAGLFKDVKKDDFVFCAVAVHEKLGQSEVRGVCFWILDFGSPKPDLEPYLRTQATWRDTSSPAPDLDRALSKLSGSLNATLDTLPAVCVIAAIKAALSSEFFAEVKQLASQGYFPVGIECSPGRPGSKLTGYINVLFLFRNIYQDERTILVPVKMSTWAAAGGLNHARGDAAVRETDALRCNWDCQKCKIACRAAQAACLAACPETGPAAAVCVAICYEAGNQCYNGC
jgi:hypothetical protein